jgi:hypothetical protein
MLPSHGSTENIENVRVAILFIAVAVSIFWREALRLLLAIAVLVVCAGAFVLMQGIHG